MRQLVTRLFKFLRGRRSGARPVAAPVSPPWTASDRDQFAAFLLSTTGQRWVGRARAMLVHNALAACVSREDVADKAARAGGYGEALEHLLSLASAADPGQGPEPIAGQQADETIEEYVRRTSP